MLIIAFIAAIAARYYVLEPVQIMDSSMQPKFKERSIVWVCKLPQCASSAKEMDYVLAKIHGNETMLRRILAQPGDSIHISDKGKVVTPYRNFKWKNEDSFIQSRSIYVPKIGDTLYFDKINDVEQDNLISLLRNMGDDVFVKTTLWQGDREINIDRVGATKIANRQVSLKEVDFLPWQDRYLIELQIRQSEPGNSPIKLKRTLYRHKKSNNAITEIADADSVVDLSLDTPEEADSAKATAESIVKDSTSEAPAGAEERIDFIVINKDCYFLACERGDNCPDSRELGYFTSDKIIGLHLKKPDEFKNKFITPAMTYVRAAEAIARDVWRNLYRKFKDTYAYIKETFNSKDASEEDQGAEEKSATETKGKE